MSYIKNLIYAVFVSILFVSGSSQAITFTKVYEATRTGTCQVFQSAVFADPTVYQIFKNNSHLTDNQAVLQTWSRALQLSPSQTIYSLASSVPLLVYAPRYAESYSPARVNYTVGLPFSCQTIKNLEAVVGITSVVTRGRSLLQKSLPPTVAKYLGMAAGVGVGIALLATIPETAPIAVGLAGKCLAGVVGGVVTAYLLGGETLTALDGAIYGCLSASLVPYARDAVVPVLRAAYWRAAQNIGNVFSAYSIDSFALTVKPEMAIALAEIPAK